MIYFVSTRYNQVVPEENLVIINTCEEFKNLTSIFLNNDKPLGGDLETNGLDVHKDDILLVIIGNKQHQIVIDLRDEDIIKETIIFLEKLIDRLIIGHNIKFDYKFILHKLGIDLRQLYDTMIAEQRIYQGLGMTDKNPIGYSFSLLATTTRRLPEAALTIDKSQRNRFIGAHKETFIYVNKDITYAAKDVVDLIDIKNLQDIDINRANQNLLIYGIEMPLIRPVGQAEIKGIAMREGKWININNRNIKLKYKLELDLDKEILRLRDFLPLTQEDRLMLVGGKYDRKRSSPVKPVYTGLFGEPLGNKEIFGTAKSKLNFHEDLMNYSSSSQIIDLFARLKQPLPTKSGSYAIPILGEKRTQKGKQTIVKVVITNEYEGFTTGAKELESFLNENPDIPTKALLKMIIKHGQLSTRIDTFGQKFIDTYKNSVTGKFHTMYRQCEAINARFQSGDAKHGYYNSQNIPKEKIYRNCFVADKGYSISTHDLTGAEVVILASKSQDKNLIRMALEEDDIHSPVATAVWKAIFLYRAGLDLNLWVDANSYFRVVQNRQKVEEYIENYINSIKDLPFGGENDEVAPNYDKYKNFYITKKHNKDFRTKFKNSTFGSVYGMYAKKAAKTLNITIEEGRIKLHVIKSMLVDTFKLVEANAKLAITQGYLILNPRTNSRLWFIEVLRARQQKRQLEFKPKSDAESLARNAPMSGTQADMIKEMIVEIQKYIDNLKLDCHFLATIHDEIVYMQPLAMDGKSKEWQTNPIKVKYINHKEEEVEGSFPDLVNETMQRVAKKYLNNIEMHAESNVELYWTK